MQSRSAKNIKIIDVSHHNGTINWTQVALDGVKGAYIKLTEGTSFLSKTAYQNYLGAKNAGLRVGFYHYAHANNDPIKEVDFFLEKLGNMKVDLPHCLDIEVNKGLSKAQVTAFSVKWLEYLQKKTGITPLLYTYVGFSNSYLSSAVAKYPLWIARYASGTQREAGPSNPGKSNIWSKWQMFQFTDQGRVKGIKGHVDVNEMDFDFFKSIDSGVNVIGDANPPSSYRKGDSGLGVKELQQNLLKLGEKLPRYGADGSFGNELEQAVKSFQARHKLAVDGIAGPATLGKITELIDELNKPKEEVKVTSLGDKYGFRVKAKVDVPVYKYGNFTSVQKTIKAGTYFVIYGYTKDAYVVGGEGGFVKPSEVEETPVTLTTGGLSTSMEAEFRSFLKTEGIDSDLNVFAKGNPSATITVSGVNLAKVKQFLDVKGWYYI